MDLPRTARHAQNDPRANQESREERDVPKFVRVKHPPAIEHRARKVGRIHDAVSERECLITEKPSCDEPSEYDAA